LAEDHNQRPYRSNETIARTGQPRGAVPTGAGPANDPLAELARLIGQTDPFGDAPPPARGRADSAGAAPKVDWAAPSTQPHQSFAPADFAAAPPQAHAPQPGAPYYAHQNWTQPFEEPAATEGAYQPEQEIPAYLTNRGAQDAPAHDAYAAGDQFEPEHDDYYDEAPPRRRMRVVLLAAVFGLAVLGTAGAFGYRTLFGSGSRVPPVIQADRSPLKVVPENAGGQGGKTIADRVTDKGEKILAREEKPVDINQLVQASAPQASAGNGVVAGEPKKVHTIVIRPDGSAGQPVAMASPMPPDAPASQAAPPLAPAPSAAARPKADRETPRAAQQPTSAQEASASAPLSLAPEAAPASRPVRTANAAPAASAPAPQAHVTAYAVQVASQKTEAEAKAAYQAMLKKYPQVLEGKSMFVYSVDLGAKGTYYRAMVGPYSAASDASGVCSALKSAGGSCLIQRN
jgi:SPOR domain